MLIAGPSGSGKTNILMNILRKPLVIYDQIYLYTKNSHQEMYQDLQKIMQRHSQKFGCNIMYIMNPDEILDTSEYPEGNRKRKKTESVPGSERHEIAKNGRPMIKSTCAECGITKVSFAGGKGGKKNNRGSLNGNSLNGGSLFDVGNSYSLGEMALKGLANIAQQGVARAVKSDFAKTKFKKTADKYVNQVIDSFSNDLSKKISGGSVYDVNQADVNRILPMSIKYGWIVPLKNKKGESVAKGFEKIFAEGRVPKRLWVDKGSEYYNSHVKDLMKAKDVEMYSTENEEKSSVCERWNRTIKTDMWKQFTIQNNTQYLDILPKIVEKYNNRKHRSIGMTPTEASKKKNENAVFLKLYGELSGLREKPKFTVGDHVRISKFKRKVFDKGFTPNWTEEIFVVDKIQYSNPITYKLKDLLGEDIKGSFYEQEMLRAKQEVFRIEKVIRKSKGKALVKWSGYPEKFNSWIDVKDLQKI
ncbi:putative uncharacterized transposon-derived protein F54H12.3 [Stylophora pistillata]|uniref:Uncharacterized transposon-derived protein F54H12.3 n=1 Tax=Stylophora pistillata TaxID=50429 RepID=A0A2B4S0E6_STYPI|nr:putative uncharacterized transposon-derived protein F54H12.3 [Stylophora pistillata]